MTPGAFRLFLASVVVVHHSFPLRLGAWAVGMFFVLSGFWIARMWRSSYSRKPRPYLTFIASRWWRLAPLFVLVQLLAVSLQWLNGKSPELLSDGRWWATQFAVLGSTQFGKLLPPAWSLDVEMQFYLLAPCMAMAIAWFISRTDQHSAAGDAMTRQSMVRLGLGLCLMTLLAISIVEFSRGASMETPHLHLYGWLFLVGMLADTTGWIPSPTQSTASTLVFLALLIAVFAGPATRSAIWQTGSSAPGNPSVSLAFYYLATIVAIPAAISTVHRPTNKWDMWLGDLSYPLYLFHWFPRDWYYAHFDLSAGYARNVPLLLANFVMAIVGAVLLLHLVDRPAQRWRKIWVQRRTAESAKLLQPE